MVDRILKERSIDFFIFENGNRKIAHIIYDAEKKESKSEYFTKFIAGFPKDPAKITWKDINKFLQHRNLSGISDDDEFLKSLKESNGKIHSDYLWLQFNDYEH